MTDGRLDPRLLLAFARVPLSAHDRAKSTFPRIFGSPGAVDGISPPPLRTEFYSCFISHSSRDAAIAKKINADLRKRGIKCWYAPEDLKTGAPLRSEIDKSIRLQDRLLVILSESSVASPWVEAEVEAALEEERRRSTVQEKLRGNPIVLFPIRIDDSIFTVDNGWAAAIRRTRNIGDFCSWQESQSYQVALKRLIGDLAVSDQVDAKARAARRKAAAGLTA
jgi:hypothetical protein